MGDRHFVLGGARSGKSLHAERLVQAAAAPWTYLATAQPFDDEMRARIAEHRLRRPVGWTTIEAPYDLPQALRACAGPVLMDCLTLWVTNLLLADHDMDAAAQALVAALDRTACTVIVSSEVGLGIVPDNALSRRFRDAAGLLHQRVAGACEHVVLMVAGLPLQVK